MQADGARRKSLERILRRRLDADLTLCRVLLDVDVAHHCALLHRRLTLQMWRNSAMETGSMDSFVARCLPRNASCGGATEPEPDLLQPRAAICSRRFITTAAAAVDIATETLMTPATVARVLRRA